jgi:hypothetical protein
MSSNVLNYQCFLRSSVYRDRGGQYKQIAESYFGLVIENFECEQSIYTAVEVNIPYFSIIDFISASRKLDKENYNPRLRDQMNKAVRK